MLDQISAEFFIRSSISLCVFCAAAYVLYSRRLNQDEPDNVFLTAAQKKRKSLSKLGEKALFTETKYHDTVKQLSEREISAEEHLQQIGAAKRLYEEEITQILVALDKVTADGLCSEAEREEVNGMKREIIREVTNRSQHK